jgi:hypothetical protein
MTPLQYAAALLYCQEQIDLRAKHGEAEDARRFAALERPWALGVLGNAGVPLCLRTPDPSLRAYDDQPANREHRSAERPDRKDAWQDLDARHTIPGLTRRTRRNRTASRLRPGATGA